MRNSPDTEEDEAKSIKELKTTLSISLSNKWCENYKNKPSHRRHLSWGARIIYRGFNWDASPEGETFWYRIADYIGR